MPELACNPMGAAGHDAVVKVAETLSVLAEAHGTYKRSTHAIPSLWLT